MRKLKAYLLSLATVILAACNGFERPYEGTYDQVLIYFGLGYNNLAANLRDNLDTLRSDVLPGLSSDKAILAVCHLTGRSGDYSTTNPPCLMRIYRGPGGKPVTDTLQIYDGVSLSASPDFLRQALSDAASRFPAHHYGMLFSSHGTGWIPAGYSSGSESSSIRQRSALHSDGTSPWPATKAVGNQFVGSSNNMRWIEMKDFAEAIPFHLDYMILDNCLSGCVELAWELRDVCDRLVVSPTEILTSGMVYKTLSWDMFAGAVPDLETYCREYFEFYDAQSGANRSGTITLVDCTQLEPLADAFGAIVSTHREALAKALHAGVQRYYYESSPFRFYYDLRDLSEVLGASSSEMSALDAALAAAVPYHAETPTFFDLSLERCCGLSVYIPDPLRTRLNAHYRSLSWNGRVHLVE